MHNKVKVNNLSVNFGNETILKNISFDIEAKKPVCVIGRGSSGKTSLLKCIIGLIKPSKGSIKFENKNKKTHLNFFSEITSNDIGVVFQKDALFDSLNVWQNIMFKNLYKKSKKENIKHSIDLLKMVDLSDEVVNLYPDELSGGMKKRVAIARAIAFKPSFLFLDEPTAGLDPIKSNIIFKIIKQLSEKMDVTIFAISSDIRGVVKNFKEIIYLNNKTVLWKGSNKDIKSTKNESLLNFISKSNLF